MNIFCKNKSIHSISFIIYTKFVFFLLFSLSSQAMEGMTLEDIKQNPELMREIGRTILVREQEKVRLKEKMCKHNEAMTNAWKSGKTWGQLGGELQGLLIKHVPKSQVISILGRVRQGEMIPGIIDHPEITAETIIENGTPILDISGLKSDQYGIKISYDLTPQTVGYNFYKGCDLHLIEISLSGNEKVEYKHAPGIVKIGENQYKFVVNKLSGIEEISISNEIINVGELNSIFQKNFHEGKVFMSWDNPIMKHLLKKEGHTKSEEKIIEIPETKAYISFNITKIIPKLLKGGRHAWDKESDGEVTTLCIIGS